jgi:hypothetical protein
MIVFAIAWDLSAAEFDMPLTQAALNRTG